MRRSPLYAILVVAFVDLISFGLIIPLQAVYAKRLGASGLTLGMLIGVYALMQLAFNPILGRWSDRVGRRRVLLISVAGSIASHVLLGVADLAISLPLLFAARMLDGITGANIATAQAYIADVTSAEKRAKGMGMFGAAFGLGFVLGPALGAALAFVGRAISGERYGTAWPAFGAAVISFAALVLVWRYLPESRPTAAATKRSFRILNLAQLRSTLRHARIRELFAISFGSIFAVVLLEATFVYLCIRRFGVTEMGTGLVFAYIGLMMIIVQGGLVGRLARRFGEANLVTVGPFISAVGFSLLSGVPIVAGQSLAWALLLVGCIPVALGQGLTTPNLSALISRQASYARQGETLGIAQSVISLARAVAPLLAGALYDIGPSWPYWTGAAIFIMVGLFAIVVRPRQQSAIAD
ncbi:MAG: MFS transporter [Phycisphaerales bacterium]|nr:MAG: MFS transporter [Phycisphaerales bacterium]